VQEGLLDLFYNETINYERYVWVILRQFFPELTEEERLYGCFHQNSATAHTACISTQALSNVFRYRSISGIWPACPPLCNPCDFLFWDCLKDKVYNINPRKEEPKENIHREMANIPAEQSKGESEPLRPVLRNVYM
jgi:hypothetical protein